MGPWQSEPRFREAVGTRLLGREQASKMWRLNRTGGRSPGPEGCRAQGAQKPRTLHVVVPGLQDTCLCWISCPRTQKVAGKNKEPGTRGHTRGGREPQLGSLGAWGWVTTEHRSPRLMAARATSSLVSAFVYKA